MMSEDTCEEIAECLECSLCSFASGELFLCSSLSALTARLYGTLTCRCENELALETAAGTGDEIVREEVLVAAPWYLFKDTVWFILKEDILAALDLFMDLPLSIIFKGTLIVAAKKS
jgi:hypothetical protein